MDLYKWAGKLSSWIPSQLLVETFCLAKDARELDMRASPYDLREIGFEPILLETSDGRRDYARLQREIAERAAPLRKCLVEAYGGVIEAVETCSTIALTSQDADSVCLSSRFQSKESQDQPTRGIQRTQSLKNRR